MRYYTIPPDTRGKEKIIGGIFTISQFIFLVVGVLLGFLLVIPTYKLTNSFIASGIVFVLGVAPFVPFSFVKIHRLGEMELFPYLRLKEKFKKSRKEFPNVNEHYRALQLEEIARLKQERMEQQKEKLKPKQKTKQRKKRRS